jgi:hypothetical protein
MSACFKFLQERKFRRNKINPDVTTHDLREGRRVSELDGVTAAVDWELVAMSLAHSNFDDVQPPSRWTEYVTPQSMVTLPLA